MISIQQAATLPCSFMQLSNQEIMWKQSMKSCRNRPRGLVKCTLGSIQPTFPYLSLSKRVLEYMVTIRSIVTSTSLQSRFLASSTLNDKYFYPALTNTKSSSLVLPVFLPSLLSFWCFLPNSHCHMESAL